LFQATAGGARQGLGKPNEGTFHLLSKGNQGKIPELGTKDMFVATQLNLEKLAEVLEEFSFLFNNHQTQRFL
jgi:hypothetical protein